MGQKWGGRVQPRPPGVDCPGHARGGPDRPAHTRSLFRFWWWQSFSVTADKDVEERNAPPASISLLIGRTPRRRRSRTLSIIIAYSRQTVDYPTTITPHWNCQTYWPVTWRTHILLLLKPLGCRWHKQRRRRAGRLAGDGGRGQSGRGQPARSRRWTAQVRVFTLHTGWLGVVTGISAASTGGFLVKNETHGYVPPKDLDWNNNSCNSWTRGSGFVNKTGITGGSCPFLGYHWRKPLFSINRSHNSEKKKNINLTLHICA